LISFSTVAAEVFQILRAFNYTVKMYGDEGNRVYEPEDARRLFAETTKDDADTPTNGNLFVSLVESGENSSIRLFISKSVDLADVVGLMDSLRSCANKFSMLFNARETGREIEPTDFASSASVTEDEDNYTMGTDIILEGMYGTTKSSYLKLENARMIVRHTKPVKEDVVGGRSRNIKGIFVEDAQGQRFLFPTRQLAPARAMTQHVNQGGNFYDQVGAQITRMAQDYSSLAQASNYIGGEAMALGESAQPIRENCRRQMKEMRKCFERLSRESGYLNESQRIAELPQGTLNEADEALSDEIRETMYVEGREIDETIIVAVTEAVKKCRCEDEAMAEDVEPAVDDDGLEENADEDIVDEEAEMEGWIKSEAVQEFSEWLDQFSPEAVLAERDEEEEDDEAEVIEERGSMDDYPAHDDGNDARATTADLEDAVNTFDVEKFLASEGEEFGWGEHEDDKKYSRKFIRRLVAYYLQSIVEYNTGAKTEISDEWVDAVWPDVEQVLNNGGYELSEGKLTRSNVLIPTDQGEDFKREVEDPTADAGSIDRLRALAGLQGRFQ
jgi:hypothetical protein